MDQIERRQHISGIDSVRALAALSVAIAHIAGPGLAALSHRVPSIPGWLAGWAECLFTGHPAVIAFFVVSGFCIHYPYTSRSVPLLGFWAGRLVRVMVPTMVAMLVSSHVGLKHFNFIDGYILWSIVCELFYYACYPLFLWCSRWVSWRAQFYLAMTLSFVLVISFGSDEYGNAHIYGPLLNWLVALPSWLAGCVLAEKLKDGNVSKEPRYQKVLIWRFTMALTASILCWASQNTPLGYYLTMNAFSMLVFHWLHVEIRAAKEDALCERLGKWSFSMYLWHMPLLIILIAVSGGSVTAPLLLVPILVLCYFLFRTIEQPSHQLARLLTAQFATIGPKVEGVRTLKRGSVSI